MESGKLKSHETVMRSLGFAH